MAACIFCQKPFGPARPRSDEHAFPKWIGELLEYREPVPHHVVIETPDGVTIRDLGERNPYTTTINEVCEPCNTGWMHELETAAEVFLPKLIKGGSRNLRYWRQMVAATWATKTAMVLQSIVPDFRAIPAVLLQPFHKNQRPPPWQQVWTGRYGGEDPHSFRHSGGGTSVRLPDGTAHPELLHGYTATLSVGELAFHIFGHMPHESDTRARWEPVLPLADGLIQIWPLVEEVTRWPPTVVLDDAAMEACALSASQARSRRPPI